MPKRVTDPIAQLMQEHDETLRQLKELNRACKALMENGLSKQILDQVLSSLKFIDEEVSHHNKREEEALFPVLDRYVEGPTQIMRTEHRELSRQFHRLRAAVEKINKGRDSRAVQNLAETGREVVQVFVNHIHKENYVLFPLVQKFLNKQELRQIAEKML